MSENEDMNIKAKNDEKERYSRLVALNKLGIVDDFSKLQSESAIIVGIGGIGSVAAEMLCRCGIGKIILFDYDQVGIANMNRCFYTPEHINLPKVVAAKYTLEKINPSVEIEIHNMDITKNYEKLLERILNGGKMSDKKKIGILLSCVDNYTARITISQICNEVDQIWFNSGVSEDAMNAQIQLMIPGYLGCFQCALPSALFTNEEVETKRDGVCTASLPTTMSITAGLLVHNTLKFFLKFGNIPFVQEMNSVQNFFPVYSIAPNPDCLDQFCQQRQREIAKLGNENHKLYLSQFNYYENQLKKNQEKKIFHADNEYNITCKTESNLIYNITIDDDTKNKSSKSKKIDSNMINNNDDLTNKTIEEIISKFKSLQN